MEKHKEFIKYASKDKITDITDYYRLLQNDFRLKVPLILYLLQITDYIHNI